jgi:hypothetical protein
MNLLSSSIHPSKLQVYCSFSVMNMSFARQSQRSLERARAAARRLLAPTHPQPAPALRIVVASFSSSSANGSAVATSSSTTSFSLPQSFASVLPNNVNTTSESFLENKAEMDRLVTKLEEDTAKIGLGGSAKARERHLKRGKMLPRDR